MRLMTFNLGLFRLTPLDLSPASFLPALEDSINGLRKPAGKLPQGQLSVWASIGNGIGRALLWPIMEPAAFIEERLDYVSDFLRQSDADVICLQEIYHAPHRQKLIRELRDVYPFHALNAKRKHFGVTDGLMILSRYPLSNIRFDKFKNGLQIESVFGHKGMLAADLESPDAGKLRLFNIHCTAGALMYEQTDRKVEDIRARQITEILSAADAVQGRVPLICGDFNMGPDVSERNYHDLATAGYSDLHAEAAALGKADLKSSWCGKNSLVNEGPDMRIDLVLLPTRALRHFDLQAADVTGQKEFIGVPNHAAVPISDHYPVTVDFVSA